MREPCRARSTRVRGQIGGGRSERPSVPLRGAHRFPANGDREAPRPGSLGGVAVADTHRLGGAVQPHTRAIYGAAREVRRCARHAARGDPNPRADRWRRVGGGSACPRRGSGRSLARPNAATQPTPARCVWPGAGPLALPPSRPQVCARRTRNPGPGRPRPHGGPRPRWRSGQGPERRGRGRRARRSSARRARRCLRLRKTITTSLPTASPQRSTGGVRRSTQRL